MVDKLMEMSTFVGKLTGNDVKTNFQPTILDNECW